MGRLLDATQLAEYLSLLPVTIRRKAKKGEIPSIRVGNRIRFDKQQIDRWLQKNPDTRSVHILVVDDEPVIGQLFKDSLTEGNYQVTTTLRGLEALEIVRSRHFDLVFLDLLLPDLDGSEVLKRIKEADKDLPVVIITGYPDSDIMNKAMEYGPFIVMKKPFNDSDIIATVDSFSHVG